MGKESSLQAFDRLQQHSVVNRRLPHWSQAGTVCFITFRAWDSIPKNVLAAWLAERKTWLHQHGIDPSHPDWESWFRKLPTNLQRQYKSFVSRRWNNHLDELHGACVLRQPAFARIVANSLKHFDGQRYELTDFVVMPNHVHLLAAFFSEETMLKQCESWKHYIAKKINQVLGRNGRFWQQDAFDHLVRSTEHFDYYRNYIAENPVKANLNAGEYLHESKAL